MPLGVAIALTMPNKGIWVSVCLVMMALPLLIPWNVVGTIWQVFARPDIGLLGKMLNSLGIDYNYTETAMLVHADPHGCLALDEPCRAACYAGLVSIPDAYYQAARIDGARAGKSSASSSCPR